MTPQPQQQESPAEIMVEHLFRFMVIFGIIFLILIMAGAT